jgi:CBS domain containing-hemolysin-like protein
VPVEGEVVEHQNLILTVTEMKGPKIEKIQIRRKA